MAYKRRKQSSRRGKKRTQVRRKRKRKQRGGALFHRKPTLQDKIAEGASMFLSGPAPSFAGLAMKLAGQAFKGVKDNYSYYKRG